LRAELVSRIHEELDAQRVFEFIDHLMIDNEPYRRMFAGRGAPRWP